MHVYGINNKNNHRYDILKTFTKFYKDELDTTEDKFNQTNAEKSYENFLKEKIKNPVAADAAFIEYLNQNPIKHVYFFYSFKEKLEQLPNISKLVNKIKNLESKYPKTGYMREVIMVNNRIKPDYVTEKLSAYKKLILKAKWF